MRLLIVTQVVNQSDPVLGFFHRWIEEFAKNVESLEVVCLYEGVHALPENVRVHSLGKERGKQPPLVYAYRFLFLTWKLRKEYDAVFVHMNVEYVLLAGVLWRLLKKRIVLWYVHGTVSLRLSLAVLLANLVCTASPESMRIETKKKRIVGHGIDTDFFSPDGSVTRGSHLLSVGRLTTSKHHDLIIEAAAKAGRELRIAGEGPERKGLEASAQRLNARVTFLGGVTRELLLNEYRTASCFVHASTTGSMDKVVLEALACDCPVLSTSSVYRDLPVTHVDASPDAIAAALSQPMLSLDRSEVIRARYALSSLIPRLVSLLSRST